MTTNCLTGFWFYFRPSVVVLAAVAALGRDLHGETLAAKLGEVRSRAVRGDVMAETILGEMFLNGKGTKDPRGHEELYHQPILHPLQEGKVRRPRLERSDDALPRTRMMQT
jgi:hypothetical protein